MDCCFCLLDYLFICSFALSFDCLLICFFSRVFVCFLVCLSACLSLYYFVYLPLCLFFLNTNTDTFQDSPRDGESWGDSDSLGDEDQSYWESLWLRRCILFHSLKMGLLDQCRHHHGNTLLHWWVRTTLDSHFGSVLASYFTLLRWVFWINAVINMATLFFIDVIRDSLIHSLCPFVHVHTCPYMYTYFTYKI